NPDPYPEDLKYPLRSDLLVLSVPNDSNIPHPEPLGTFEQDLQKLKSDKKNLDPADLPSSAREELEDQLDKTFGTPREPTVKGKKSDQAALKELGLTREETLPRGSVLYRRHCVHCHGLSGDGRGPTATWVNPHPRDY